MTSAQRELARAALSAYRLERARVLDAEVDERDCLYCGAAFPVTRPNRTYCCSQHKKYGWATLTPQGRAWQKAKSRRLRAAKKAVAA